MPAKFFRSTAAFQPLLEQTLEALWEQFPHLTPNQIALTWIVYEPPYQINTGGALSAEAFWQYQPQGASYRGVELIEPMGMVSLFYLVALQVWLEQEMLQSSAELERAMRDMVAGSADAMSYVIDALSGTTSGPELAPGPATTWQHQRNIVNRYFQQLGWPELRAVNVNQKVWRDRPYGRERHFFGDTRENKNLLSTEAIARLLHSVVGGVSVSAQRSQLMMNLLQQPDSALGKVWSISGDRPLLSYSASYIEAPQTHPYQLVTFVDSKDTAQNAAIRIFIEQQILERTVELSQKGPTLLPLSSE